MVHHVHATKRDVVLDGSGNPDIHDDRKNILPFDNFYDLLRTFNVSEPVKELRRRGSAEVWAPDLVKPSQYTRIIPWVLAGEPCIQHSRVPTSAVFALHIERKLEVKDIANLYPSISTESISDSIELEARLRGLKRPTSVAVV